MGVLTLVRHGQASFFGDDYDLLSPTGEAQARHLGDHLASLGEPIDEVFVGPRRRQLQTAAFAGAAYRQAGRTWPEPTILAELDEYDLAGLIHRLAPALARQDQAFAELMDAHRQSVGEPHWPRAFQRMFEALTMHWLSAVEEMEAVEGWPSFRDRVQRGLQRITGQPGHGRRVAAFTSGGFIATAVGLTLAVPDRSVLELNWRVRNCSLTRMLFTGDRLTLDDFNTIPHLSDPALWTYR